jgi:hypothetical protein
VALSTPWTLSTIRTKVRRELADPNGRWWTDAELNSYASDWQNDLQRQFEFVWGTETVTTTASDSGTFTLSTFDPAVLRLDAVYYSDALNSERRLVGHSKQELDILNRQWRDAEYGTPKVVYQDDSTTFSVTPPPALAGTFVMEYPQVLTLATDTDTVSIPAWTQHSVIPYCCYRAYKRLGPNQDLPKALQYKSRAARWRERIKNLYAAYFPDKYLSLRPASVYEQNILDPLVG